MHTRGASDNPRPILSGIQLLRGLSAVLVVAAHANLMMGNPKNFGVSPFPLRDAGMFGVAVFFVISGFIIGMVSLDTQWRPRLSKGDYAWRRFVRIVPFLWLSVIGYNILSSVGTGEVEWLPFLRAMTLWPIGELKPNVVWSLQHEMIFYILFALAMLGTRIRLWILALWFVAPLVYGGAIALFGHAAIPANTAVAELFRVVLLGGFSGANVQFGAGFILGLVWLRSPALSRMRLPGGLVIATILIVLATVIVEIMAFPIAGFGRMIVWSAMAMVIVAVGMLVRDEKGPLQTIGMILGNASFSIYLVHNAVLLILFKAALWMPDALPLSLLFFFFFGVATLAGVVVHYLVEAPLISLLSHGQPLFPWQRRTA
jgi:peptidoglycan/LPS O-acetylase OafA/YrhL